jgi:hypothetical protein
MIVTSVYLSFDGMLFGGPLMDVGGATESLTMQQSLVVASPTILAPDHAVGISHHDGGCGSRSPPVLGFRNS